MSLLPAQSSELAARPTAPARQVVGLARYWPVAGLALAAGAVLLRLPYLDVPLSADEGGYATAAYWWARGDTLYQQITITRPQGIFVVFRLLDALGLGAVRGIHLAAALWVVLAALMLLATAARVWGHGIGLGAAALFAAAMATPYLEGYSANAELWMLPPLLGSLYLLLLADERGLADRRGLGLLAASGALGMVATLLKPSAIVALPLAALWLLRRWRVERAPWRALASAEVALALGAGAGLLPSVVHGLLTAPDRYLSAVVFYRLGQDSLISDSLAHQFDYLATNSLYILAHLPLLLLAPFGFALAAHRGDRRGRDLLWLWTLTALGGTALGGNWFLHYYQQLLPPLAVAVALGVRWLWRSPRIAVRILGQALTALGIIALAAAIVLAMFQGVDPKTLPEWEPGVSAAAPIAAYLQAHTAPAETVYVAYDHADIYYLSQRRPAARWLHFRELGGTPGALDEQFARLANPATAPCYIVEAQSFDRWGFDVTGRLRALVARDYRLETTIDGINLYRRIDR
ncbi:MAG: hypothetical protein ACTHMP_21320 [Thermomicrobiales bacterium]